MEIEYFHHMFKTQAFGSSKKNIYFKASMLFNNYRNFPYLNICECNTPYGMYNLKGNHTPPPSFLKKSC